MKPGNPSQIVGCQIRKNQGVLRDEKRATFGASSTWGFFFVHLGQ